MYTILGAGGAIGNELAKVCIDNKQPLRLVGRKPKDVPGAESKAADLLILDEVREAVKGSSVVFLTAGIQYKLKVWQMDWPVIMDNVIRACVEHNARLVFFDNIYCLGKVDGPMKEDTPFNPCSKKGEVRAYIAGKVLEEVKLGNLKAIIARSADFYGPGCKTSGLNLMAIEKLLKGKKAQCFVTPDLPHSFTYTPDCGRALWTLSRDESAWNQIWHMPTASPAPTTRHLVEIAASQLNQKPGITTLGKGMCRFLGIFIPVLKEMGEMMYQNDSPYIFDSSKIEQRYGLKATPYEEGIRATIQSYR